MTTDYEITYILKPTLEEADVDARAATFAEIISTRGGTVGATEKLGKKRLAYEIADVREGNYVVMGFKSDAAAAKELDRQMGLHEDVLRTLIVRMDKKALAAAAAPPRPIVEPEREYGRGDRDRSDRGDRDRDRDRD